MNDVDDYIQLLSEVKYYEDRPNFIDKWNKIRDIEPKDENLLLECYAKLSRKQLSNSSSYIIEKLLMMDFKSNKKSDFLLKMLSLSKGDVLDHELENALFEVGVKRNSIYKELLNILDIEDKFKFLPHILAGTWVDIPSKINSFNLNMHRYSIDELIKLFTSLKHVNRWINEKNHSQIKYEITQLTYVLKNHLKHNMRYIRGLCSTDGSDKKKMDLFRAIYAFLMKSLRLNLIENSVAIEIIKIFNLENIEILDYIERLPNINNQELYEVLGDLLHETDFNLKMKQDKYIDQFFDMLYGRYLRGKEKNIKEIFQFYFTLKESYQMYIDNFRTILLKEIANDNLPLALNEINNWIQKSGKVDQYFLIEIIDRCLPKDFSLLFNLVNSWLSQEIISDDAFLELLKQIVTMFEDSIEKLENYPELLAIIKTLFNKYNLDYNRALKSAKERSLLEIAVAINELLHRHKIDKEIVKLNLAKYSYINNLFGDFINIKLEENYHDHVLIRMLNFDTDYLLRFNHLIKCVPDVANRKNFKELVMEGGDQTDDAFSELEIAYFFQSKFGVNREDRFIEQQLYERSKLIDFKFKLATFNLWVEVKNYFGQEETRLFNKAIIMNPKKLTNNIWSKFKVKFPNITQDEIESISEPVLFAIGKFKSFISKGEIENYLKGSLVLEETHDKGNIIKKRFYRKDDSMSQKSPETKILSGIILFSPDYTDNKNFSTKIEFIENPHAKNPIPVEVINQFHEF